MVFLLISTDFTLPLEILLSPFILQYFGFESPSKGELWSFTFQLQIPPTCSLRPVILMNACPPCITAAAGTEVSRDLFLKFSHYLSFTKELYDQNSLLHSRNIARSSFRSLSKIPHCCHPGVSRPCLSSSVAGHPLRPAKDHRLGEPLPHQLPNLPRAHPSAVVAFIYLQKHINYVGFYPSLKGRFPRVTHPFAKIA